MWFSFKNTVLQCHMHHIKYIEPTHQIHHHYELLFLVWESLGCIWTEKAPYKSTIGSIRQTTASRNFINKHVSTEQYTAVQGYLLSYFIIKFIVMKAGCTSRQRKKTKKRKYLSNNVVIFLNSAYYFVHRGLFITIMVM